MKYFQLVETYPGSPELGALYSEQPHPSKDKTAYAECGKLAGVPLFDLQKYPKFWRPILRKSNPPYIVLLFKHHSGIQERPLPHNIERLKKEAKVHSIKRVSDGTVFTVGDRIYAHRDSHIIYTIKEIELWYDHEVIFYTKEENTGYVGGSKQQGVNMGVCFQSLTPLIKTEDGYEIFNENELLWDVSTENWDYLGQTQAQFFAGCLKGMSDRKAFYKKKNAKRFLLLNRPMLSVNDLLNYLKSVNLEVENLDPKFIKFLKRLKK